MKNVVLDPALLFITEIDWANNHKRDWFLAHLLDNLTNIDQYSVAQILWNDELESCLWSDPHIPPWRQDKDWGNQLVPIIYRLLKKNIAADNFEGSQTVCNVQTVLDCSDPNALICFLRIMHRLISFTLDTLLCLGLPNILPADSNYTFYCTCCSKTLTPELIKHPTDWLRYIDVENKYWPGNVSDSRKFKKGLDIIRLRDLNDSPFLHNFQFSPRFIDDLALTHSNRLRILRQIAKRLTLTAQQAALDASLQDEYLNRGVYRFRVTPRPTSTRIHYSYDQSGAILFLR